MLPWGLKTPVGTRWRPTSYWLIWVITQFWYILQQTIQLISLNLWITDDGVKLYLFFSRLRFRFSSRNTHCVSTRTQLWLWNTWVRSGLCCVAPWCNRWNLPLWPPPQSAHPCCAPAPPATLQHAPGSTPLRKQKVCSEEIGDGGCMHVLYAVQPLWLFWHECGLFDRYNSSCTSLVSFLLSLSSFSKQRQKASRLRWILIRLWWRTSSVWMKWSKTWTMCLMLSKMTSHATSAFGPHQVFSFSVFSLTVGSFSCSFQDLPFFI